MTRLENELNALIDTLWYPTARYTKTASYPPYNVVRLGEDTVTVEIAAAGFRESELAITLNDNVLKIAGRKSPDDDSVKHIYKGIGARSFERTFTLSKDAVVEKADYVDGILSVTIKHVIPEEKKPKTIPINQDQRHLLIE